MNDRSEDLSITAVKKPRGNAALGKRVQVFWKSENSWFAGVVSGFSKKDTEKQYRINYDDGEERWEQHRDLVFTDIYYQDVFPNAKPKGRRSIGHEVSVYWNGEKKWFTGKVIDYSSEEERGTKQYLIKYDDDQSELWEKYRSLSFISVEKKGQVATFKPHENQTSSLSHDAQAVVLLASETGSKASSSSSSSKPKAERKTKSPTTKPLKVSTAKTPPRRKSSRQASPPVFDKPSKRKERSPTFLADPLIKKQEPRPKRRAEAQMAASRSKPVNIKARKDDSIECQGSENNARIGNVEVVPKGGPDELQQEHHNERKEMAQENLQVESIVGKLEDLVFQAESIRHGAVKIINAITSHKARSSRKACQE